ncbi:MAG: caspase family protein [Deltaproteobacteria bacterium]|nr:caspase family protein [Deltaproteobacteria bacterium]
MRAILLLLLLLPGVAIPAELPSIDDPLRTGSVARADAAVIIGVEDYGYLPDVPHARRDAEAMRAFMVYTRGVAAERVVTLGDRDGRAKMLEAIDALGRQVGPGGTAWVYFAGHGAASPRTRERILLPGNTTPDEQGFDEMGLVVSEIQTLAGAGGGEVMLITDACFTGAGRDGSSLVAGGRSWVPSSPSAAGKVAQWDAAQANQVARPLDAAGHGAFTYFALGALRGWADGEQSGSPDGKVTAEEAQLYVQRALAAAGLRDQTPLLLGTGVEERVLSVGARASGPDLRAIPASVPSPSAPVQPGGSGTNFGSVAAISVDDKLARQQAEEAEKARLAACDAEAKQEADAARSSRLDALAATTKAEATAAWAKLRPGAEDCAKLTDTASRSACASQVDAFVKLASSASVTLGGGDEPVQTACGPRVRTYPAATVPVAVRELDAAVSLAAKIRAGPGSDWRSPTLGAMKWIPAGSFTMGSPSSEAGKTTSMLALAATLRAQANLGLPAAARRRPDRGLDAQVPVDRFLRYRGTREQAVAEGVEQLSAYLDTLGAKEGWLLVFDQREGVSWDDRLWSEDREVAGRLLHLRGA